MRGTDQRQTRIFSLISAERRVRPDVHLTHAKAVELLDYPDLFKESNIAPEKHFYENHCSVSECCSGFWWWLKAIV